jgi:hypothetical protein
MFKSETQKWLEQQPKHTQEWLKKQAIWRDADLAKVFVFGAFIGFLVGVIVCQL